MLDGSQVQVGDCHWLGKSGVHGFSLVRKIVDTVLIGDRLELSGSKA